MTTMNLDTMADEDVKTFFAGMEDELLVQYATAYGRVEHVAQFKRLAKLVRDEVTRRAK